jgi:hypothetical protein
VKLAEVTLKRAALATVRAVIVVVALIALGTTVLIVAKRTSAA